MSYNFFIFIMLLNKQGSYVDALSNSAPIQFASSLLQICQFYMLAMYNGQYPVLWWKILVWDHSDHQLWTPYKWSMPLDRCSPVFSVRDKSFQKVTNWSALVPEINSEQRELWPLVYWTQLECNGVSGPQLVCGWSRDHKKPRYDIRLMTSHFLRNVSFAC